MSLYVYALADAPGGAATGVTGESLRWIACAGLYAAVGEVAATPAADPASVRGHDSAVRALAANVRALLPARFGSIVRDEGALAEVLSPRLALLRDALELVADREQMTLRIFGSPEPEPALPTIEPGSEKAGTRYLQARLEAQRARHRLPELDGARSQLEGLVVAERVERHFGSELRASVFHLVKRGEAERYRERIARISAELVGLRLTVSGPWPAYAFAPEAVE